jgi:hypothetical protein
MNQIDEKLVWAENLRKAFIAMKREKALNSSVKVLLETLLFDHISLWKGFQK